MPRQMKSIGESFERGECINSLSLRRLYWVVVGSDRVPVWLSERYKMLAEVVLKMCRR